MLAQHSDRAKHGGGTTGGAYMGVAPNPNPNPSPNPNPNPTPNPNPNPTPNPTPTPSQVCERLAAAGVEPSHPVYRRAAAALRNAAAREPDEDAVRAALAAAARVEAPVYLGRGEEIASYLGRGGMPT